MLLAAMTIDSSLSFPPPLLCLDVRVCMCVITGLLGLSWTSTERQGKRSAVQCSAVQCSTMQCDAMRCQCSLLSSLSLSPIHPFIAFPHFLPLCTRKTTSTTTKKKKNRKQNTKNKLAGALSVSAHGTLYGAVRCVALFCFVLFCC